MADFTDVADALVSVIAPIAYPSGTTQPSVVNAPVVVYQGWPNAVQLDKDLKAGKVHVSVWPTPTERETSSRMPDWQTLSISAPTVTLTVNGSTVTVGGTGGAGQNAALIVDGKPYVYAVQANDTPTSIATALATLVSVDRPASSAGAVITIPNPRTLTARVGTQGTSIRELRRQEKVFQISVWANCFDKRDPLAKKIDAALAGMSRISLVDGLQGVLRYKSSIQHDDTQKNGIYRRDMLYAVEYSITETSADTQIVTDQVSVSPQMSGAPIGQIIINS